jgi:putative tricarboxylic transport membrane protein
MYYAWQTLQIGSIHVPDAGFLPFLCGMGLAILGIVWLLILQWAEDQGNESPAEKRLWHRPVLSLVLMVLYGWAMEAIGYVTATLIFMIAWQQIIEREKWFKTALISLLGTLAMYALFVFFLRVPVPQELFLR